MESPTVPLAPRFARQNFTVGAWLLALLLLGAQWFADSESVDAAVIVTPRLALVVFTDHSMPDAEWTTLSTELVRSFDNLALETHSLPGGFDVVRGDTLVPGVQFDVAVSIYLHGDCRPLAQPGAYTVHGALGWVLRDHGQIEPFIHVDCARISEVLGQHVLGMNHAARDAAMAEAISRVALHEWLHIATQNSAHSRTGISKRAFGWEDLMPNFSHRIAPSGNGK